MTRVEESTTDSLRQMSDKYQSLEEVLAQTESDLAWEGDTHKAQLAAAEAISQQREAECVALQIQNRDLIHAYNIEKVRIALGVQNDLLVELDNGRGDSIWNMLLEKMKWRSNEVLRRMAGAESVPDLINKKGEEYGESLFDKHTFCAGM